MDLNNIVPTVIAIIFAIPATINLFKDITDYFNLTSNQLKKYLIYEQKYSNYYENEVKNHIKNQIRYLSLLNLTDVKEKNSQLVYFDLLQEDYKNEINRLLLSDILNYSVVYKDKFIKFIALDYFESRASYKRAIIYYSCLVPLIICNLFILPTSLYYDVFILEKHFSGFWITLNVLLIIVTPFLIGSFRRNVKPISKKSLDYSLELINLWNQKIRKESA